MVRESPQRFEQGDQQYRLVAAAARVPDELVLKSNLIGTDEMVRERLRVYQAAGVTTLRVEPDGDTLDERLKNLGRLMELVKESDFIMQSPNRLAKTVVSSGSSLPLLWVGFTGADQPAHSQAPIHRRRTRGHGAGVRRERNAPAPRSPGQILSGPVSVSSLTPRAQPFKVFGHPVLRPVDDAQILRPTAFHRRLHNRTPPLHDEIKGLHYHSLAAARGEFSPPENALL